VRKKRRLSKSSFAAQTIRQQLQMMIKDSTGRVVAASTESLPFGWSSLPDRSGAMSAIGPEEKCQPGEPMSASWAGAEKIGSL
jgi:hypothetical protein